MERANIKKKKTEPRVRLMANMRWASMQSKKYEKTAFIIDCIASEFGINKANIMCDLINLGLEKHPTYKERLKEYSAAFEKLGATNVNK